MRSFNEFYQQILDDKEIDNLRDIAAQLVVINDLPPEQFFSELLENTNFGEDQMFNELLGGLGNWLKDKWNGKSAAAPAAAKKYPPSYNPYEDMNMSGRGEDSFNKANDPSIMFSRAVKILNDIIKVYSDYGYRVKFPDGQRVPLKDFLGKTVNMLNQLRQSAPTSDNLNARREKFFNNAAKGATPPPAGMKTDFARNSGEGPSPELRQAFDKRGSLMQQAGMPLEPGDAGYMSPAKKKRVVRPTQPAAPARNPYEDYVFRAMT